MIHIKYKLNNIIDLKLLSCMRDRTNTIFQESSNQIQLTTQLKNLYELVTVSTSLTHSTLPQTPFLLPSNAIFAHQILLSDFPLFSSNLGDHMTKSFPPWLRILSTHSPENVYLLCVRNSSKSQPSTLTHPLLL